MNTLPSEVHLLIAYKCRYRDNIYWHAVSKYFQDLIDPEEILYETVTNRTITVTDIYTKYYRGKSYHSYDGEKDIPFILPLNEHILYQRELVRVSGNDPTYILITINNCGNFIVYEFHQEVHDDEYTPEYHGYDINDNDKLVLVNKMQYDSLNTFRSFTSFVKLHLVHNIKQYIRKHKYS